MNNCSCCTAPSISFFRGDTVQFKVTFSLEADTIYQLNDGDVLRFGIFKSRTPVLVVPFPKEAQAADGTITISFTPEQTQQLAPGEYTYEAELVKDSGETYTAGGGTLEVKEDYITPEVRNDEYGN